MSLFKQASCADELLEGMESAQIEKVAKDDSREQQLILEAMQELNAAAECFERTGRKARAKEITELMTSLAKGEEPKLEKKASSISEVEKTFLFFGFSPEELGFSSNGDTGNRE
jgi:hypothetical protein